MRKNYNFDKGQRGPVAAAPSGKSRITIRLDRDVIDWFKGQAHESGGGNYQTQINQALCEHMARQREPLEATLRRVVREELGRTG